MKITAFVFAILCGSLTHAQNIPDSLKQILSQAETDSARLAIYSTETWRIRLTDPAMAVIYGIRSINLAKEAGLQTMHVDALTNLGYTYEVMGEADSSLKYYHQGYQLADEISYLWGAIDGANGSGTAYQLMGDSEKAIEMYEKAIYLSKDDERPLVKITRDMDYRLMQEMKSLLLADAYNNIGVVYEGRRQLEVALEYYQKSLVLYNDDNRARVITLMNMGGIHLQLDNLEKANEYYSKANEDVKPLEDQVIEGRIHFFLGRINHRMNNYPEALEEYGISLNKYESLNNQREISKVQVEIGSLYFEVDEFNKSLSYYKQSLEFPQSVEDPSTHLTALLGVAKCQIQLSQFNLAEKGLKEILRLSSEDSLVLRDTYMTFSLLYEKTNQFKKAYEFQKEYVILNDLLSISEQSERIAEIEAKFETVEKEKAIDLLNAENEINALQLQKQENQRNILIGAILVFMVLVGMLYSRYKTGSKANKKLRQLDELKSKFFTNISHEFRTPLTLILSPIIAMLSKKNSKEEKDQLLVIKRNADRLLELINQLLDLSKLEAGSMRLQVIKGDFSTFIRTIVSSFESLAAQKEIKLSIDVPNHSEEVIFDPEKCHQIFFNLLSNAFKFTSKSGEVDLRVAYETTRFSISITDTGKGIPQEDLTNIFKRFHQLGDSKNHQQGTGIGLALVKELVGLHHGEIEVSSEVNVGTTFTTHFPLNESIYKNEERREEFGQLSIPKLSSGKRPSQTNDSIDGELVLVVEDNDDVRNYIRSIVSNSYEVIEAINGKEGLDIAVEKIPDLIISDLMMPEMDGNEFCKAIKTNETTSHIPVVMLTAKADDQSKTEGFETGADDYLVKPFNEEILKTRIRNLIEQRKRLREKYSNTFSLEPAQIAITPPDELFMKRVKEIVEINISKSEFSIEEFQREIGMSRMQLHRKLKALTNCSASEFIRKQRLRRAAQILKIEGMSVSEAAYSSGFSNLSYFAKCFKEEFGKTPSAYS